MPITPRIVHKIVTKCYECPYLQPQRSGVNVCILTDRYIYNDTVIPAQCTLPEAEEAK